MPETEWNSTTTPEEGAIVYVFETKAGETLAREKSSMLLSRDGAQQAMPNDDDALLPIVRRPIPFTVRIVLT